MNTQFRLGYLCLLNTRIYYTKSVPRQFEFVIRVYAFVDIYVATVNERVTIINSYLRIVKIIFLGWAQRFFICTQNHWNFFIAVNTTSIILSIVTHTHLLSFKLIFKIRFQECNVETVILISPKLGISQIIGMRSSMVSFKKISIFMSTILDRKTETIQDLDVEEIHAEMMKCCVI